MIEYQNDGVQIYSLDGAGENFSNHLSDFVKEKVVKISQIEYEYYKLLSNFGQNLGNFRHDAD